jgi:hypothetical protein
MNIDSPAPAWPPLRCWAARPTAGCSARPIRARLWTTSLTTRGNHDSAQQNIHQRAHSPGGLQRRVSAAGLALRQQEHSGLQAGAARSVSSPVQRAQPDDLLGRPHCRGIPQGPAHDFRRRARRHQNTQRLVWTRRLNKLSNLLGQ